MYIHLYIGQALRWNLLWNLLQPLKTCTHHIWLHGIRSRSTTTSDPSSPEGRRNHPPEASRDQEGGGGVTYVGVSLLPPQSVYVNTLSHTRYPTARVKRARKHLALKGCPLSSSRCCCFIVSLRPLAYCWLSRSLLWSLDCRLAEILFLCAISPGRPLDFEQVHHSSELLGVTKSKPEQDRTAGVIHDSKLRAALLVNRQKLLFRMGRAPFPRKPDETGRRRYANLSH